ncbi:MAG: hypothetical protein JXB26_18910 [Candidatus Aminicenantes bacterium]|nr:hypothetical protein [Candidatus Aminicenantes bacterium]
MLKNFPEKVFVDRKVWKKERTRRILKNVEDVPCVIIDNVETLINKYSRKPDPVGEGKKVLWITEQKGDFVKPCPCTPAYLGCCYYIINLDLNCPFDCTYCILQHYLTNPLITTNVNLNDLWKQLDEFLDGIKGRFIRIGTGELADSLALDHITGNSRDLIAYFRGKKNVHFELKTKSVNIDNILMEEPEENIVVSWSLNSEEMALKTEADAPSIDARLEAAAKVCRRGFRIGFHFDPLFYYSGFAGNYDRVIKRMFQAVPPSRIAWISLGSLRFPPFLKRIIQNRFPKSRMLIEELVPGKDGKYRYFMPLRKKLYEKTVHSLRKYGGEKILLYFCMEGRNMWNEIIGWKPRGKEDIEKYLSFPQEMS